MTVPAWYTTLLDGVESDGPTARVCEACGETVLPPRSVCPDCGGTAFRETTLSPTAEVASFTEIHVTIPEFHGQAPYTIVVADFDEGVRLTGRLSGADSVAVGDIVTVGTERLGAPGEEGQRRRVVTFAPA